MLGLAPLPVPLQNAAARAVVLYRFGSESAKSDEKPIGLSQLRRVDCPAVAIPNDGIPARRPSHS